MFCYDRNISKKMPHGLNGGFLSYAKRCLSKILRKTYGKIFQETFLFRFEVPSFVVRQITNFCFVVSLFGCFANYHKTNSPSPPPPLLPPSTFPDKTFNYPLRPPPGLPIKLSLELTSQKSSDSILRVEIKRLKTKGQNIKQKTVTVFRK